MEQNEQEGIPYPYPQPISHITEGIVDKLIDINQTVTEIENYLLGRVKTYDDDGNIIWEIDENLARVSQQGARVLIQELRSSLSKTYIFSSFRDEQITSMARSYGWVIRSLIIEHRIVFGIKSTSDASAITNKLFNEFYATLLRARDAMTMKYMAATQKIHESSRPQQPQPEAKGLISRLLNK